MNPKELSSLNDKGEHTPESLATEGFVHCSFIDQVAKIADKRFEGKKDLSLLQIDSKDLKVPLVIENTSGGQSLFPHVYGPISLSSVLKILEFPCNQDGKFDRPDI